MIAEQVEDAAPGVPLHVITIPFSHGRTLDLSHRPTQLFLVALMSFFGVYFLLFSWQTHAIFFCMGLGTLTIGLGIYSLLLEQGLLSFLPGKWRTFLLSKSLLDLSQVKWSDGTFTGLLQLFLLSLDQDQIQRIVDRLPGELRTTLLAKGIVKVFPVPVQRLLYSPDDFYRQYPQLAITDSSSSSSSSLTSRDGEDSDSFTTTRSRTKKTTTQSQSTSHSRSSSGIFTFHRSSTTKTVITDKSNTTSSSLSSSTTHHAQSQPDHKHDRPALSIDDHPLPAAVDCSPNHRDRKRSVIMEPISPLYSGGLSLSPSATLCSTALLSLSPTHSPLGLSTPFSLTGTDAVTMSDKHITETVIIDQKRLEHEREEEEKKKESSWSAQLAAAFNGEQSIWQVADRQFKTQLDQAWRHYLKKYTIYLQSKKVRVFGATAAVMISMHFIFSKRARRWALKWSRSITEFTLFGAATLAVGLFLNDGFKEDTHPSLRRRILGSPESDKGWFGSKYRKAFAAITVILTWVWYLRRQAKKP